MRIASAVVRALLAVAFASPIAVTEAQRPSDAQALLQARPELIAQLRARIQGSGLTPAQVRARLQAEGYPANLLDAYLVDSFAADSGAVTDDVFSAVQSLGIADSASVDSLRRFRLDTLQREDSLRF